MIYQESDVKSRISIISTIKITNQINFLTFIGLVETRMNSLLQCPMTQLFKTNSNCLKENEFEEILRQNSIVLVL